MLQLQLEVNSYMRTRRILAAILSIAFILTSYGMYGVYGADIPVQPPPTGLAITPVNPPEPAIGYSASDGGESGFYADISWGNLANPSGSAGINILGKYLNIYLEESPKGYKPARPVYAQERGLAADTKPVRMRNLKSGTVYKANAKAYYEYINTNIPNSQVARSDESAGSNSVRFLTDINVQCFTAGTGNVKVIWDDVWVDGRRISYKLYISEDKEFKNAFPVTISEELIGKDGPVVLNETDGTLEYTQTVKNAGRVYYVKLEPELPDNSIIRSDKVKTYATSTNILVKTTRMFDNDEGTVWKLEWSPVLTSLSGAESNVKVEYEICRYENNVPTIIAVKESTMHIITVPKDSPVSYYLIRAKVTKDGLPYYPPELNIKIESEKVALMEMEVPTTPPMPVIVPSIKDSTGKVVISYEDIVSEEGVVTHKGELGKDTATILWEVPKKADGTIDDRILYDIWLTEDPNTLDSPPASTLIRESFQPAEANFVRDATNGNQIIGYKYKLTGLIPNHTYYFKLVAKKTFAEEKDGIIQNVTHSSVPAIKLVITLSGDAIDTPLIPSNPPLEIKKQPDSDKKMITDKSVTIQLKNRWYEKFNKEQDTGRWYYVKTDRADYNDPVGSIEYNPYDPATPVDNINYRKVQYGEGVSLYVGCEEYYEGIEPNLADTAKYPISGYKVGSVSANPIAQQNLDQYEIPDLNAPDSITSTGPVTSKHNIVIPVNTLKPNTTYVIWVRAARPDPEHPGQLLLSDVSNPIIFTTLPSDTQVVENPTVPELSYNYVSDTFVDLVWDYKEGNKYYIKYGTVDNPDRAGNPIEITTEELISSGFNYLRVPGLKPDTQYYFWIQAESFSPDHSLSAKSVWSDSLLVKTLKDLPPATPRGFGVKNTPDAVTKNSIIFEWIEEDNLEYILEIASDIDYTDAKEYTAGSVAEFKVEGLISNHRYFARLYAYDPAKKLRSQPTQSINVRTRSSSDDYDSDQDVDHVITGDYIEKGTNVIGGVWTVKIIGVNADRLIERMKTDRVLDYTVDLSKPPATATRISVWVAKRVFDNLEQLKENIAFRTTIVTYDFKAGILSDISMADTKREQIYILDIVLTPQKPVANANELVLKQPLAQIGVKLETGADVITVSQFSIPLVIRYPYTNVKDYTDSKTYGYYYNPVLSSWEQQVTSADYDTDNSAGVMSFKTRTPGLFAIANRTGNLFDDIYGNKYEKSITNVAYKHKLKSVTGRSFSPDKIITAGDAVKILFDTIDGYKYDNGFMQTAAKLGLIKANKLASGALTRQEAACMATVLYEIKSGTRTKGNVNIISSYSDYGKVDKTIQNRVAFAVENGFVPNVTETKLNPDESISRGEFMYMLEKALVLTGEIE